MVYLKRGLTLVVFTVGLIFLLSMASWIFVPKNNQQEYGMEEITANGILGEQENTIDVLVLGDSESYSAITPMQMWKDAGYTAYVCGTSGQMLEYSNTLLHRVFERQKPKIVILETDAIYRDMTPGTVRLNRLIGYFSVFQYHNRRKALRLSDFGGEVNYTWTDDYKGYAHSVQVDSANNTEYMKQTESAAEIPNINVQYVKEMKAFCDRNQAEFILLSTPSTVNWNSERHNGICRLAEEIGCEYVDLNVMNDKVQIDWSRDTRDKGDHLNYFGAVKVTKFLTDYLMKKNTLTDHRTDETYAKWNDALKRYEAAVK